MEKNKKNILGIDISTGSKKSFEEKIKGALHSKKQVFVTTPNPEIILEANKDEELHYILNFADLSIADGIGVSLAGAMIGHKFTRWPGSEICTWLLEVAETSNKKVAILAWSGGLSTKNEIEVAIKDKYPKLDFIVEEIDKEWSLNYYQSINIYRPEILLVGTGSPSQEKFIYKNLKKMDYLRVAIGVGGSFDYLTGKVAPSPMIFKSLGLEWFWRLINIGSFTNPFGRFKRVLNAVFVFPIKYLKWLLINPLLYRENVSCLLFKVEDGAYKFFVLNNINEPDHWQTPQGGTEGESITDAGIRELREELGTYKIKPIKTYKNLHKYQFNSKHDRAFRNYKGQNQGLLIAEYYGDDYEIKLNYWEHKSWKWVKLEELLDTVHSVRKEATEKYLELFKKTII